MIIAFHNFKGGVGTTTLVAHTCAFRGHLISLGDMGHQVIVPAFFTDRVELTPAPRQMVVEHAAN